MLHEGTRDTLTTTFHTASGGAAYSYTLHRSDRPRPTAPPERPRKRRWMERRKRRPRDAAPLHAGVQEREQEPMQLEARRGVSPRMLPQQWVPRWQVQKERQARAEALPES